MLVSLVRKLARKLGRRVVYGVLTFVLLSATVGAALTESLMLLLLAFAPLMGILAVTVRDVRINRIMVHQVRWRLHSEVNRAQPKPEQLKSMIEQLRSTTQQLRSTTQQLSSTIRALEQRFDELEVEAKEAHTLLAVSLLDQESASPSLLERTTPRFVDAAVLALLRRRDALDAYSVATGYGRLTSLRRGTLRMLRNELRRRGYLTKALEIAKAIRSEDDDDDRDLIARRQIQGEIAVMSGEFTPTVRPEAPGYKPKRGRVLHLVGRSLPADQVGYTLRTHYIATAQLAAGLDPHVVTQMGYAHEGEDYAREVLDGITYHRIPGPQRSQVQLDVWMRMHVQRVANLVRVVRPAVLHAASDFVNAQTALAVGKEFGLPVIYESRGFWEETWLSRTAEQYRWDLTHVEATFGLPETYLWRRAIEDRSRREADHVVTLDGVMAERIEAGGVPSDRISIVPNGVAVDEFPVLARNGDLAAQLGVEDNVTVIGYISSLVEYEGIDTLISAYAEVKKSTERSLALLIVGEGPVRDRLMRHADSCGLDDVIFTGQVPHSEVINYYSVIDIFVVPRRPADVCHLVTPLKPFEAFSTGRVVVLSDVRALNAIARQSGAAEVFRAGDASSLAGVLIGLLADPERRGELAYAGAAWVRRKNSWEVHAQAYVRLYEHLGVVPLGALRIPRLEAKHINVQEFATRMRERKALPYEQLTPDDRGPDATTLMTKGWKIGPHPRVALDLPIDWLRLCIENRSWNFHLHAWDFMGPVLNAYSKTGDRACIDWCIARAVSWARQFNDSDDMGTMAWYDMALGLRGHRLAYLVEQAFLNDVDEESIKVLLSCVVRHQKEYFAPQSFKSHSNHGAYVAIGEIAMARRLSPLSGMDVLEWQGQERIADMALRQFAADGGHLEHSPDYHRMLLETFRGAINAGLLKHHELQRRLRLAEDVLEWFVQPNGELVQVGDSPATPASRIWKGPSTVPAKESPPHERWGPPGKTLLVLPETGYAIVRAPGEVAGSSTPQSSYLFLMAAFHSQMHKHADDLAITWYDRDHEILVDAGRYGYVDPLPKDAAERQQGFFYSSPKRQYVESTRAHNTVEVDGTNHIRRGRTPHGSALVDAEERDGYYRLIAEVNHGNWNHRRDVIFHPARWLYVVDRLQSTDEESHDFRVWWNFPEEAQVLEASGGLLRLRLSNAEQLWVSELTGAPMIKPVAGQREPMRGWRSKRDLSLVPALSAGFEARHTLRYEFRTLFRFSDEPDHNAPVSPFTT